MISDYGGLLIVDGSSEPKLWSILDGQFADLESHLRGNKIHKRNKRTNRIKHVKISLFAIGKKHLVKFYELLKETPIESLQLRNYAYLGPGHGSRWFCRDCGDSFPAESWNNHTHVFRGNYLRRRSHAVEYRKTRKLDEHTKEMTLLHLTLLADYISSSSKVEKIEIGNICYITPEVAALLTKAIQQNTSLLDCSIYFDDVNIVLSKEDYVSREALKHSDLFETKEIEFLDCEAYLQRNEHIWIWVGKFEISNFAMLEQKVCDAIISCVGLEEELHWIVARLIFGYVYPGRFDMRI